MALAGEKAIDHLGSPLDFFHAIGVLRVLVCSHCAVGVGHYSFPCCDCVPEAWVVKYIIPFLKAKKFPYLFPTEGGLSSHSVPKICQTRQNRHGALSLPFGPYGGIKAIGTKAPIIR